jgi:hypothetical protein
MKELLSLCPKKLHCPVPLETLFIIAPDLQIQIQWILAHLLTPLGPWRSINSGDTRVLRFDFDFSTCQRHLADFFHSSQIEARCHFY